MVNADLIVSTSFAKRATSEADRKKFQELVGFFQKYSEQYQPS